MDVFGYVQRPPEPGETVIGDRLALVPGGKGANQAVAARRLGAEVRFVGACGGDGFGDMVAAALATEGVGLSGLKRVDARTGVALILVSQGGENQIVVLPGANALVDGPDPDPDVAVWLAQAEVPVAAVERTLAAARSNRVRWRSSIRHPPAACLPELVHRFDIAIVNQTELEALGSRRPPTVVLTLGAGGAQLLPDGPIAAGAAGRSGGYHRGGRCPRRCAGRRSCRRGVTRAVASAGTGDGLAVRRARGLSAGHADACGGAGPPRFAAVAVRRCRDERQSA